MNHKVKDLFDIVPGLFQQMDNVIWKDEFDSLDMDIELVTNHGLKTTSPLVDHFIAEDSFEGNEYIDDIDVKRLANIIYRKNRVNWERKFEVLKAEYDLFDTYNVIDNTTTYSSHSGYEQGDEDNTGESGKSINSANINELELDTIDSSNKTGVNTNDSVNSNVRSEMDMVDGHNESETNNENRLQFEGRKDVEDRNLHSSMSRDSYTMDNTYDELIFTDREDENLSVNVSDEKGHTLDLEVDDGIVKDTGKETETTYGFDGGMGPLAGGSGTNITELDGTPKSRNIKDLQTTEDNSRASKHEVDMENSQGTLESNKKKGKERNQKGGTITVNDNDFGNDSGTVENSKEGVEKTNDKGGTEGFESTLNSQSGMTSDTSFDESSYEDEDIHTREGTEKNHNMSYSGEVGVEESNTGSVNVSQQNDFEEVDNVMRGNTSGRTAVDILQEHVDFWQWNYIDDIIEDVVKMITLDIYEY